MIAQPPAYLVVLPNGEFALSDKPPTDQEIQDQDCKEPRQLAEAEAG